ncbi:MAG: DNA primase [bacterium]|nr:DNA primase [bacterium]
MSTNVEQIKSRLNIVDVVGSYLKLDKAGGNLKARCPFHNEKSPSFFVSPVRESFHCFGCNKGGDIFEFVKEIEGIEFIDALKILAEKAGVKLNNEDSGMRSEKGRLIALLENAVLFYRNELKKKPEAIEYLRKRGLTDETISTFQIGFAPDSWRSLCDHLRGLKFTDMEIEKTGLAIRSPKGIYDRFRSRIMFPIANISGVVVGFSGRIFGSADKEAAKYINSPQTDLYDKSKIMFGFDKGRVLMRTSDSCILVEGQMDLVMSHQAGKSNTVAVSGTALTEEHIKNIKRLSNKIIFAFDGDEAGFKASHRGIDMALASGMDVRVAKLPIGIDPADLILEDGSKWTQAIEDAKHIIDFYLETLEARDYESRMFKIEVEKLVLPYVARIKSSIEQAHFVNLIARKLGIDEAPVWEALRKIGNAAVQNIDKLEVVQNPSTITVQTTRADFLLKKMLGIVWWQRALNPTNNDLDKCEVEIKEVVGEGKYFLLGEILKDKKDSLIFEAEVSFSGSQNISDYLGQLTLDLQKEVMKESLNEAIFKLKKAEATGDQEEIEKCLRSASELSIELANIKH